MENEPPVNKDLNILGYVLDRFSQEFWRAWTIPIVATGEAVATSSLADQRLSLHLDDSVEYLFVVGVVYLCTRIASFHQTHKNYKAKINTEIKKSNI